MTPRASLRIPSTAWATSRTASTSRPESISSRTAAFGLSDSNWRISDFFFSPPDSPTLTNRSRKEADAGPLLDRLAEHLDAIHLHRAFGEVAGAAHHRVTQRRLARAVGPH